MTAKTIAATIAMLAALPGRAEAEVQGAHRAAAARAHALGEALADEHRFDEAATQFATAFSILDSRGIAVPDARAAGTYLYAWAQAERLAGSCDCAIALYQEFGRLARAYFPDSESWPARAEAGIAACPAIPPARQACRHGLAVAASPAASRPAPRPWYRDPLGGVLAGGGLAAIAVGAWSVRSSLALADDAERLGITYDEYARLEDRARVRNILGWTSLGIGAALVGGAIVRYATRAGTRGPELTIAAPAGPGLTFAILERF
jgi:hypothetical protein